MSGYFQISFQFRFRFQRVPAAVSSSRMPRASRSFRILSASAKLRPARAARRAWMSWSISSTGTGGRSSSARRSDRTPSTRSNPSNVARTAAASSACSSPASIDELSARTRSNTMPSAAGGVEVGADLLGERGRRLLAAASPIAPLAWPAGSASSRARKSVIRLSASSDCASSAHENFSCLR